MLILVLGLVLFLGTHAFTMNRAARSELIGRLGAGGYKGLYTLLSAAGIVLIVWGYGVYRANGYIPVWDPPRWLAHIALLLNLPIFILLASMNSPGLIRVKTRHPMLLAIKLWATAHLLANGDLGSILLFGGFLVWAILSRISLKRRADAAPIPASIGWTSRDTAAVVIGLVLYVVVVFWAHRILIGVSPIG